MGRAHDTQCRLTAHADHLDDPPGPGRGGACARDCTQLHRLRTITPGRRWAPLRCYARPRPAPPRPAPLRPTPGHVHEIARSSTASGPSPPTGSGRRGPNSQLGPRCWALGVLRLCSTRKKYVYTCAMAREKAPRAHLRRVPRAHRADGPRSRPSLCSQNHSSPRPTCLTPAGPAPFWPRRGRLRAGRPAWPPQRASMSCSAAFSCLRGAPEVRPRVAGRRGGPRASR